ncbi:GSCOCG00001068001-RA-CDS, partial [Cotesia congregata]
MPLKIESGTYTVNPAASKKGPSRFFIWKHWRCSVHEDRTPEERRNRGGHSEVAGLEEDNGKDTTVTVTGLPGSGGGGGPGGRPNRRTRPLSLAVQPLHYQRLDTADSINTSGGPESAGVIAETGAIKHPNMTSQESIGSCSLDVDRSASDRSGWIYKPTVDSVSERTLHSLNLSSNGDTTSAGGNSSEIIQKHNQQTLDKQPEQIIVDNCDSIINGENEPTAEQLTTKKPSYLGLACSISGYSGITRYDSKLREGFRSRDSSPGSRLITRETSPAGFRSNENLGVPPLNYPTKSQSISPLAMDRQNGFTNGKECKIETFVESRSTLNVFQGYSEVDRGVSLHPNFPDVSPILSVGNKKTTTTLTTTTVVNNKANKSYSPNSSYASSPRGMNNTNLSNISCAEDSFLNGSSIEIESQTLNLSSSSEKSFIQQRVERLYGPGALAQGFFRRSNQSQNSDNSFNNKSSLNNSSNINNNDLSLDNANNEESLKNLPVLRHLRPEFRAQLPVVSPRRPTDGSEQIVKPMQRISVSSRKNDVTVVVKVPVATVTQTAAAAVANVTAANNNDSLKLSPSMTSITDQQPAAPEVVLPVLETSVSSTSLAELPKATQEDNAVEVKDGHYFMKLLKAEIDRLFKLAASAEAELANVESLPEEAAGKLRSAAGKARLLATQKMQQFEGLCQKNITQIPGEVFPTTNEDLAGFWDMVMLQVVQVNDIFEHLDKLRNSQWQEVCSRSPVNVPGLSSKPIQSNHPIHGPKLSPNVEKPFQQIPKSPQSVSKPNRPISKPKSGIPRAINTIKHGKMIFKSP